jgi:hypothetical protein
VIEIARRISDHPAAPPPSRVHSLGPKLRLGPQLCESRLRLGGTPSPPKADTDAKRSFENVRAQPGVGHEWKVVVQLLVCEFAIYCLVHNV